MEKQNKTNQNAIFLLMKNWKLRCVYLIFFMWIVRFQILICEQQSILRKLLVLGLLYPPSMKIHNQPDTKFSRSASILQISSAKWYECAL